MQSLQGSYAWLLPFFDHFKPQLASSIKSYKLWCQAWALLLPARLASKMSGSTFIHYFFQTSSGIWVQGFLIKSL